MKNALRLMMGLAIIAATATIITAGTRAPFERNQPLSMSVSPPNPAPNQDVQFTVTMDGTTTEDVYVTIGCTDTSAYSQLPSYVVVPYGQSQKTFAAHTSSSYSSWAVVAATANGGTALVVSQVD